MDPGVILAAPEPGLYKEKFILRIPTMRGSGCGWGRVKSSTTRGSDLIAIRVWLSSPPHCWERFKLMKIRQNELESPMIGKMRSEIFHVLIQEGWLAVVTIQTKLCLNNDAKHEVWTKWRELGKKDESHCVHWSLFNCVPVSSKMNVLPTTNEICVLCL